MCNELFSTSTTRIVHVQKRKLSRAILQSFANTHHELSQSSPSKLIISLHHIQKARSLCLPELLLALSLYHHGMLPHSIYIYLLLHLWSLSLQEYDSSMLRLQPADYVAPGWPGVARRQRLGRLGARTGKTTICFRSYWCYFKWALQKHSNLYAANLLCCWFFVIFYCRLLCDKNITFFMSNIYVHAMNQYRYVRLSLSFKFSYHIGCL